MVVVNFSVSCMYHVDIIGSGEFFNLVYVMCRHNWWLWFFQPHVCNWSTQLVKVIFYSLAYTVKMLLQNILLIPCSHKCGIKYTQLHVLEKKRRSTIELSNKISEKRCDLKINNPVSERVNHQFITGSNEVRVSIKYGVYYTIVISFFFHKNFASKKISKRKCSIQWL